MSSREEFEAWLSSEYPWGNEALDKAFFSGNDDNGYYTGGDFIYDGSSCADALFWAWRGWQESYKQNEAKCTALAAENVGLKALCEDRRTFIMNGVQLGYIKVPTVETDPALETIRVAVSPQWPTPATDAFLAEVRAHGVERLANAWYAIANETDPGISISDSSRLKYRQRADDAADFANDIRQEAAQ